MSDYQDELSTITIGGTIFNYACPRQTNSCIRRRIVMREAIDSDALIDAMESTRRRYPQLSLGLARTKDRVYEEHIDRPFKLNRIGDESACIGRDTNGHMIGFFTDGNTLIIDFFHAIADDIGMDRFIHTLLHAYLQRAGHNLGNADDIAITCDTPYDPHEGEDAGLLMVEADAGNRPDYQPRHAFKIRGRRRAISEPDYAYTVHVDLDEFKSFAKAHESTPTAAISVLFSRILYHHYSAYLMPSARPITAEVAVNLRNHFPTESVRNFVGNAYLTYDASSDQSSLLGAMATQSTSLRTQNTAENQAAFYRHAFALANRWFNGSSLPVYAKNWVHKHIAVKAMSDGMTYGISNIGKGQLPACLKEHVAEYYTMVPSGLHSYLISMRSEGDTLTLCITSKLHDSGDVVAKLVDTLCEHGMPARIVRTEDFNYSKYVQNQAVTPAHENRVDLSPAMDKVLLAIERTSIAMREINIAVRRRFA